MSEANLALVRRIYDEGLMDNDHRRLLELASERIEFVNPPEAVEGGVRRGRPEAAEALRNVSTVFDSSRHELIELFDAGDRVVAAVRFVTRGRGSENELVQNEAHTWTIVDGAIERFEWSRDLSAALEAAGVRE